MKAQNRRRTCIDYHGSIRVLYILDVVIVLGSSEASRFVYKTARLASVLYPFLLFLLLLHEIAHWICEKEISNNPDKTLTNALGKI